MNMQFRTRFALIVSALFVAFPCTAEPVLTGSGYVEGVQGDGFRVFEGIPFAAPPVGPLRWRAPQPAPSWSGIKEADSFSPVCPQIGSYPPEAPPEKSSEDCLYLNVWTPAHAASRKLPVMVWIYGGALVNGSASTPLYWGDRIAQRNVILVTANYRLGVLGFLALKELSKESKHGVSGNYGLLDQIAALNWVHRNIAAFGGDPANVTIFGQSSGAISTSALAASPLAKGLFHRVIAESGGLFEPVELSGSFQLAGAENDGEDFLRHSGAKSLANLRRMPADALVKMPFDAHFVMDGYALTKPPYDAYRDGVNNNVDILVGSNADEGQLFLVRRKVTADNLHAVLARDFPSIIVSLLGPKRPTIDAAARGAASAFEGDMRFGWDMWTWARLAAWGHKGTVFYYQFTRAPPFAPGDRYYGMGATHGMEMPYVFGHLDQQNFAWTAQDRLLSSRLLDYWTNFAATGNPNGPNLPFWPQFDPAAKRVMLLGLNSAPAAIPHAGSLHRIDRLYTAARFIVHNVYGILATGGAIVIGLIWALWSALRRRWLRSKIL